MPEHQPTNTMYSNLDYKWINDNGLEYNTNGVNMYSSEELIDVGSRIIINNNTYIYGQTSEINDRLTLCGNYINKVNIHNDDGINLGILHYAALLN